MPSLQPEFVIDIAVPTYNCAKWIDDFLTSLAAQDHQSWRVITRDDGSTDSTPHRVEEWAQRLPGKIKIISNTHQINHGAADSYNMILAETDAPFVMLADPDDIWKPNKISTTLAAMRQAEETGGPNKPVAIFSDAEVVDETGRLLAPSYWTWSRMQPEFSRQFHRMLVESPAISSTMMVNRATLTRALPIMGSSSLQDWWLALVACRFGRLIHLHDKTIQYRRHAANDSDVPLTSTLAGALRNVFLARQRIKKLLRNLAPQSAAFLDKFGSELSDGDITALEAASRLPSANIIVRRWLIIRHRLWFASPLKNLALMILM